MQKKIIIHGLGALAFAAGFAIAGCSSSDNTDTGGTPTDAGPTADTGTTGGTDGGTARDAGGGGTPDAGGMVNVTFSAVLSGEEETPPVQTTALGGAIFTLNGTTLSYRLSHNVMNATAAHIHLGAVGASGNPVITLMATGDASGTMANVSADVITALMNGGAYVNVHSTANAGGEIRGQIGKGPLFKATLSGANETPPVNTTATGIGYFTLDGTTVKYHVIHNVMNPTAAHIHKGAPGASGNPIVVLTMSSMTEIMGTGALPADNVVDMVGGNTYVNVHSQANGGGEIRGQVNAVTP